jgi:hypothetical protein
MINIGVWEQQVTDVERRQPGAENGLTMEGEHLKVYEDR